MRYGDTCCGGWVRDGAGGRQSFTEEGELMALEDREVCRRERGGSCWGVGGNQ